MKIRALLIVLLLGVAACASWQDWVPIFEPSAAVLCDETTKKDSQETRDRIRLGLAGLKALLDGGELPADLNVFLEDHLGAVRPATRQAMIETVNRLRERVSTELPMPEQARVFSGLVLHCMIGLQPIDQT